MKAYKYVMATSMVHFGGVIYKSSEHRNTVFDTGSKKWESVKDEIEEAFDKGFLKMTKESAEAYKKDQAGEKPAAEKPAAEKKK